MDLLLPEASLTVVENEKSMRLKIIKLDDHQQRRPELLTFLMI